MVAIAVIVGGRRTILGPVLGTAFVVLLQDLMPGAEIHGMYYGVALIITLLLFPEGVMGINWKALLAKRTIDGKSQRSGVLPPTRPLSEANSQ